MKKLRILLSLFFIISFFLSNAQDVGSSWTIKSPGVKHTSHKITKGKGLITSISKKQKAIVFEEKNINPNSYDNRILQFKNKKTDEILFEQKLIVGEKNIVSIPLKPIKKKYTKNLYDQEFIVVEIADDKVDKGFIVFKFEK